MSFVCHRIPTCDLLQFGGTSLSGVGLLNGNYRIGVMPLLGESVNLRVVFRCAIRFQLSRVGYYSSFAKLSSARMIVLWHDTIVISPQFRRSIQLPIVSLQNGIRSDVAPIGGESFQSQVNKAGQSLSSVDTYFVFGEQSETFLRQIVNSRFIHAGSFRLNEYALTQKHSLHGIAEGTSLGLIVSFPNKRDVVKHSIRDNHDLYLSVGTYQVSHHSYFRIDSVVAQVAAEVARELGVSFSIIGKRSNSDGLEREYFAAIPGCENVPVLGHEKGSGYQVAERFTHLLAIDSTLGYEMLALGKRVGFVANRMRVAGISSNELTFGHPLLLPSDGPFWTSASTPADIRKFVLRFLNLADSEWAEAHRTVTPRLMKLDPGNTKLRAYIDQVLAGSR